MSEPFLIRHADGREFELNDVGFFVEQYQPDGFAIVDPAPTGYVVPDLPADGVKAETDPHKMKRADLDAYAVSIGIEGAAEFPNKDALLVAVDAALNASGDGDVPDGEGSE